jgi:phosphate acetyltransferase
VLKDVKRMVTKQCIKNRTFDEISIADEASLSRTLIWRDAELFAAMSGDVNPAHVDEEFARSKSASSPTGRL